MIKVRQQANDYFNCRVFHEESEGGFIVAEEVHDSRESIHYSYSRHTIATGFETMAEAGQWLEEKRKEQQQEEKLQAEYL